MWQTIRQCLLQADGTAGGADPTPDNGHSGVEEGNSSNAEFTTEQQAKIQSLINQAFAKGAAKAGKDASKGVEEKIAELEGKLAEAEREKQIAATSTLISAKGWAFQGDKADENNAALARLLTGKDKEESACNVTLLDTLLSAKIQAGVDTRLRTGGLTPPPATDGKASINDKIRAALKGV